MYVVLGTDSGIKNISVLTYLEGSVVTYFYCLQNNFYYVETFSCSHFSKKCCGYLIYFARGLHISAYFL